LTLKSVQDAFRKAHLFAAHNEMQWSKPWISLEDLINAFLVAGDDVLEKAAQIGLTQKESEFVKNYLVWEAQQALFGWTFGRTRTELGVV
jgi:hypothetical protein